MAWIESHQSLRVHHKTYALADLLCLPQTSVIGILQCLWWWALDAAPDGDLSKFKPAAIAHQCFFEGEPARLVNALVDCGGIDDRGKKLPGFLEYTCNAHLVIHDWNDYAGRLISQRKINAERMRNVRENARSTDGKKRATHVQRTCKARAGVTVQYSTVKKESPHTPQGAEWDSDFDTFWTEYGKIGARAAAHESYVRARRGGKFKGATHGPCEMEPIMSGLAKFKMTKDWTKDGGQYRQHASTWLNQRRWEDALSAPSIVTTKWGEYDSVDLMDMEEAREKARQNGISA